MFLFDKVQYDWIISITNVIFLSQCFYIEKHLLFCGFLENLMAWNGCNCTWNIAEKFKINGFLITTWYFVSSQQFSLGKLIDTICFLHVVMLGIWLSSRVFSILKIIWRKLLIITLRGWLSRKEVSFVNFYFAVIYKFKFMAAAI